MDRKPLSNQPTFETRITRALGAMPYLPTSDFYSVSAEPETLAKTLESFAVALARVAKHNEEEQAELRMLRSDLAAVRRVFGTVDA